MHHAMQRVRVILLLGSWLLIPVPASTQLPAAPCLVYLDMPGDEIEGAALISTLDAYLADAGYASVSHRVSRALSSREDFLQAAREAAAESSCLAVFWIEEAPEVSRPVVRDTHYLALYEARSQGMALLPLSLPQGSKPAILRLVSATARMALDTEVLLDIERSAAVAKLEPTPDPWSAPVASTPATVGAVVSPQTPPSSPSWSGRLAYRGDFSPVGIALLGGPTLGAELHQDWLSLSLEVGFLSGTASRTQDVEARPIRVPMRVGAGGIVHLGRFDLVPAVNYLLEPMWLDGQFVEVSPGSRRLDPQARLDTGLELALGLYAQLASPLQAFVSLSVCGMLVSHAYERFAETVVASNYVRIGWSAGLALGGQ